MIPQHIFYRFANDHKCSSILLYIIGCYNICLGVLNLTWFYIMFTFPFPLRYLFVLLIES